jgi:hypothetical protein
MTYSNRPITPSRLALSTFKAISFKEFPFIMKEKLHTQSKKMAITPSKMVRSYDNKQACKVLWNYLFKV